MIGAILFGLLVNFGMGVSVGVSKENMIGLSDFEKEHIRLIVFLGLSYWILKLVTYPLFIPLRKRKNKREAIKKNQEKLERQLNTFYNVSNMQIEIAELKSSVSQDLYSRAIDSYNDMLHILIKCSDGEGNLDTSRFKAVINGAIKECREIVELAYAEMNNRVEKAKNQYYNIKEEEIKQDLNKMRNKNKEFREMWKKGDE